MINWRESQEDMRFTLRFMGLNGCFLQDALPWVLASSAAGVAAAAVLGGVVALWRPEVVLDGPTWIRLVLASVGALSPWLVPGAGAAGIAHATGRWRREGAWIGLAAAGIGPRVVAPALLGLGLATAAATGLCTHLAAPLAHRAAADATAQAMARVSLWPGRSTRVADLVVRPERVRDGLAEDVLVLHGDRVAVARSVRRVRQGDQLALEWRDAQLHGAADAGWQLSFERWVQPLTAADRRIELVERSTPDLARVAAATEAHGGAAAYEWTIWHKRWLHPLAATAFCLAAAPLGTARRPGVRVVGLGLAYLVMVRAGDALAAAMGGLASAALAPVLLALAAAVLWSRWEVPCGR